MKNPTLSRQGIYFIPSDNLPGSRTSKIIEKHESNIALQIAKTINRKVIKSNAKLERKEKLFNAKDAAKYLEINQTLFNSHKRLGNVSWTKHNSKIHFFKSALDKFEEKYGPDYELK
jgi:hypothetical protein